MLWLCNSITTLTILYEHVVLSVGVGQRTYQHPQRVQRADPLVSGSSHWWACYTAFRGVANISILSKTNLIAIVAACG